MDLKNFCIQLKGDLHDEVYETECESVIELLWAMKLEFHVRTKSFKVEGVCDPTTYQKIKSIIYTYNCFVMYDNTNNHTV